MEDIIQKYKKEKKMKNFAMITLSLMLALGLNFIVSQTQVAKYLKSSVLDTTITQNVWDLYLEQIWTNLVSLKSSKPMADVKTLSFAMVYNKENVDLKTKILKIEGSELLDLSNKDWINTIIINFKTPISIQAWQDLLSVAFERIKPTPENINITSSNFTDKVDKTYILSTSWIDL